MPLTQPILIALLDPTEDLDQTGPVEHRLLIRGADQLRAELEGKRQGVKLNDAMHTSFLWAWAAAERTGVHSGGFRAFVDRAVAVETEQAANGEPAVEDLDPTRSGPGTA